MTTQESAWEFRRRRAVELCRQGEPTAIIARYLDVGVPSVRRWVRLVEEGTPLNPVPSGGRPRRISSDQIEVLRNMLAEGATAHGWPNDIWTLPRVREIIQRYFGIKFCRPHTLYVLNHYLGWTSQRPITRLRARDEDKIRKWPKVQFKRILHEASIRNAYIAFVDEAGFMLMPTLKNTYSPRGQRPILKIADPHGRISTACAITISPERQHANLHFQMLADNANYTGHSIATFLSLLCDTLDSPVIIVWDCIPIHLAKPVLAVVRTKGNVFLRKLPKYAPELNPADKVWSHVKYARLANYAPPDLVQLRDTVKTELQAIKKRPALLHSFVRRAGLDIGTLK